MNTPPSLRAHSPLTRADFHAAQGVLLVVRNPPPAPPPVKGQPALVAGNPAEGVEILIAVWDDGSVTALNGHVDLGTGIRTALAQMTQQKIISGSKGKLNPTGKVTRAEVAKMLYMLSEL